MDYIEKLCNWITIFVKNNSSLSSEDIEVVQYGIHIVLINVIKFIALLIAAIALKVEGYFIIAFISFSTIRCFANGVHASNTYVCTLVNFLLFFGIVYGALILPLSRTEALVIYVSAFLLLVKYSPADTAERPLTSAAHRKILKKQALMVAAIYLIPILVLNSRGVASLILYALFAQSLLITPLAYKIFRKEYRNYEKVRS